MISSFTLWSSRTTSSRISCGEQGLRHRGVSRGGGPGLHPHSSLPEPGWRAHWTWGTLASPGASHASGALWGGVRGAEGRFALVMAGAGDKRRAPPLQLVP